MTVATLDRPRPGPAPEIKRYEPWGANREIFARRDPEVLIAGPAGTGKSRAALEKMHLCALKYPGMRGLIVRKTRESMTESVLVTFDTHVRHDLDRVIWRHSEQEYRYPNGSTLVVRGLDKPGRIMSTEYDIAFAEEAIELTETDWESITTRLRNGAMPYQQIMGATNPDAPTHWLKQRADIGKTVMLESRHEDNPVLFDRGGQPTERGAVYMSRLDALSGVRFLRLRRGIWAAAEGVIYEDFDEARHVIDRMPAGWESWRRYWTIDFGFVHPFVWQAWAVDPDGALYMYREIHRTQRIVEDHARMILAETAGQPRPVAVICDHDAEDRATLERHIGIRTTAATKTVSPGIQAVTSRLRGANGRPRLFFLRGALVEVDPWARDAHKPLSAVQEFPSYVWETGGGRRKGEEPHKEDDDGMDATRYMVAQFDVRPSRKLVIA